jgi:hypothetical protein
MKLTVLAAMSLALFLGGCTVTTTSDHTILNGQLLTMTEATCGPVTSAPFFLPDGATNDFSVSDADGGDLLDVTIADFTQFGCDLAGGYGTITGVTGTATFASSTGGVLAGNYDYIVNCRNIPGNGACNFYATWTASY